MANSGGILSLWNKSLSKLIFPFAEEGFIDVCLECGPLAKRCFVVNVYSKCDLAAKKRWSANFLTAKFGLGEGVWCIVGGFNAVCRGDERRGVNEVGNDGHRREMRLFKEFLEEVELEDLNPLGRKFTWYHTNGVAMSRIDRTLVSENWVNACGIPFLWVLHRDVINSWTSKLHW